jgi:hypothetical protein
MASTKDTSSSPNGKRLIPHIIDDLARREPSREAFQVPISSDPKDGWKVVTFKEYANSINHVARRIIEINGEPKKGAFPTIAYIGPQDARYVVRYHHPFPPATRDPLTPACLGHHGCCHQGGLQGKKHSPPTDPGGGLSGLTTQRPYLFPRETRKRVRSTSLKRRTATLCSSPSPTTS